MGFAVWSALSAFMIGACVGSFVGVVAYRLPREISIVTPRSFCPRCKKPIRSWSNIPIVSYLVLRGRCAACGGSIGFRYFLAELGLGAAACYLYLHYPLPDAIARFAFCATLFIVALIDYDWRVIHNAITLGGILLCFLAAWLVMPEVGWRGSLAGLVVGAGFLFLTGAIYSLLRGAEGVGMGDVFLLGMTGAFLGIAGALFTLFVGSIAGAVGGLVLAFTGVPSLDEEVPEAIAAVTASVAAAQAETGDTPLLRTAVPFGPFLALAAGIFALFQRQLLHWYFAN